MVILITIFFMSISDIMINKTEIINYIEEGYLNLKWTGILEGGESQL